MQLLFSTNGSFILELKRKQKRRRFQPFTLFPMCVFILQRQKDQRKNRFRIRFRSSINEH